MATPFHPRSQIRDIDRRAHVRARGAKARGVRRGLSSRGIRELQPPQRAPRRHTQPASLPLTQMGALLLIGGVIVLLALIAILFALRF